jgi:hypothetical protein
MDYSPTFCRIRQTTWTNRQALRPHGAYARRNVEVSGGAMEIVTAENGQNGPGVAARIRQEFDS